MLPYRVQPPSGSIELLFSVDPDIMLRGRTGPPGLRHITPTDRQSAKRINRFVARFGYRFVFSRDRTHEALITMHADTSPVMEAVGRSHPTGGARTWGYVFAIRPNKPKWTDRSVPH